MFDETVKTQLEQVAQGIKDSLESSIAELKDDPKMTKIIEGHKALNNLEEMLERPKTSLAEVFGLETTAQDDGASVQLGEFYGIQPLEAAKRYLRKKGSAAALDEIVAALRKGGCVVNSPSNLRKTLTRSTYQVAKVGKDAFGLVEFYPHAKRGRRKERADDSEVAGSGAVQDGAVEGDDLDQTEESEEESNVEDADES